MEIVNFLEDLTNMTKEEMEKRSIPAPLDKEGYVCLTKDYWNEIGGIRYLKKPLMVDFAAWCLYTLDCASLVSKLISLPTLCVIAFSVTKESTDQLGSVFFNEHLGHRGYGFFPGFAREELNSFD